MMRKSSLIVAALLLAACSKQPAQAPDPTPALVEAAPGPAKTAESIAMDVALSGLWQPYDTTSYSALGTMDVQGDRLVFGKGLTLRIAAVSAHVAAVKMLDGSAKVAGPDTLCGAKPVLSVSFDMTETAPRKVLRVSVHDIATGPGPDPDFDLHRCQTFTYVRD